jgi:hypothetical protein
MTALVAATPSGVATLNRLLSDVFVEIPADVGVLASAVWAFLTTLVVGALAVGIVPERTEAMMERLVAEPFEALMCGVAVVLLLLLVLFALVVTVLGVLVAYPLLVVAYCCWAVGATVAYLAVADRLVGHEDGWLRPLVLAAGLSGGLTATGVGGFLGLALGVVGFGAVLLPSLR